LLDKHFSAEISKNNVKLTKILIDTAPNVICALK